MFIRKIFGVWPLLIGIGLIAGVATYYILFNSGVQVFHYDMIEQVIRFIMRGYQLIRQPGITWWDWNHYLGANVFVYGYYYLFSPFWLILAALPKIDQIPYAFMYVNLFKLIVLFFTSYLYFNSIRKSKISVFAGSSIITFSGFVLGYYNYTFFTDSMIFVPVILMFVEKYLQDPKKFVGLVLSIASLALINVYLTILFTPFIFLYTLLRYLSIHQKFELKSTVLDSFKFLGFFILGIGLACVIFLPNLNLLLSSSRVAEIGNFFKMISWKDAFRYLTGLIQPVVDRNNFNPLINKTIVASYGHSGGAAVYSLMLSLVMVPQLLFRKDLGIERNLLISLYVFFGLFSLFPNLYFLLQGNNDTRWMVSIILLNAYVVSLILDEPHRIKKLGVFMSSFGIILLLGLTYIISRRYGLQNDELYFSIAKRNVMILTMIVLAYTFIFTWIKNQKIFIFILAVVISIDAYFSVHNMFFNPVSSISMDDSEIPAYQLSNSSLIDAIKNKDLAAYRIDVFENAGFNNPLGKDYMGFTFYSSVYNFNVDDFIQNNISSAGGWVVTNNIGKWHYKEMFGSKYWVDMTHTIKPPFGYSNVESVNYLNQSIDIYQNNYPVPLIYAMTDTLNYQSWKILSSLDKMRVLMNQVITYDSTNTEASFVGDIIKLGDFSTDFERSFETPLTETNIYVELPRSEEVWISAYMDDQVVQEFYNYEPQYTSMYVENPFNKIVVRVSNLYGVPESEFINTVSIDNPKSYIPEWYENMSNQFATDIKLDRNSFSANIEVNTASYVVTSIAFDESWKVYANGKLVEVEKVNGGFIGFKLDQGDYTLKGEYFPIDLVKGFILSIFSLLALIIIYFRVYSNSVDIKK